MSSESSRTERGTRDVTSAADADEASFRFRIVHLVYVIAVTTVCIVTFGPPGIIPGAGVLAFWSCIFSASSRPKAFYIASLALLVGFCLLPCVVIVFDPFGDTRPSSRAHCSNNMRLIQTALLQYETTYGRFPPPFIADANGKPMHSWRVLILPFIGEQAVYDIYDFDEPWNGPKNRKLWSYSGIFACPSEGKDYRQPRTSYLAVVGDSTCWTSSGRKLREITDGPESTVLLVEHHSDIHWFEPRDLPLEEALQVLPSFEDRGTGHTREDFFAKYYSRGIAWADGNTGFVKPGIGRATWSAMLTVDGGERWSTNDLEPSSSAYEEVKWENYARIAVLGVLTLLPLPWVWLNPTSKT